MAFRLTIRRSDSPRAKTWSPPDSFTVRGIRFERTPDNRDEYTVITNGNQLPTWDNFFAVVKRPEKDIIVGPGNGMDLYISVTAEHMPSHAVLYVVDPADPMPYIHPYARQHILETDFTHPLGVYTRDGLLYSVWVGNKMEQHVVELVRSQKHLEDPGPFLYGYDRTTEMLYILVPFGCKPLAEALIQQTERAIVYDPRCPNVDVLDIVVKTLDEQINELHESGHYFVLWHPANVCVNVQGHLKIATMDFGKMLKESGIEDIPQYLLRVLTSGTVGLDTRCRRIPDFLDVVRKYDDLFYLDEEYIHQQYEKLLRRALKAYGDAQKMLASK